MNEHDNNKLRVAWPLKGHTRFLYSKTYYTIWGCMTDPLWLQLNKHLITAFILQNWERDTLEALCRAGYVEPTNLQGYHVGYPELVADVVDEMIRVGKVILFAGKLGEECAFWLKDLLKPSTTVFISYTNRRTEDANFARNLKDELVSEGLEVWFDEDSVLVGDSIPESISNGIVESDFFLMVFSSAYMKSPWVKKEVWSAVNQMIKKSSLRIIPCMIEKCELPAFIADLKYADFTNDYSLAFDGLLKTLDMNLQYD